VNRALRAATVGVLLLSPLALSACSAGQVTQTATQERDKAGAMAQVGDITVRAAKLTYPSDGAYERGDDAELRLVIVNSGQDPDALIGVEGPGFGGAQIQAAAPSTSPTTGAGPGAGTGGGNTATPTTGGGSTPATDTGAAPATDTGAAPATDTGTAPATGTSAAPTTGATPSTGAGSSTAGSGRIEIPADTSVFVDGESAIITLTGLNESLTVGQYIEVTLRFEDNGQVILPVTVANPNESLQRGSAFNFHTEANTEEGREGQQREGGE
jgi:copper(I)-binding protein